VSLWPLPKPPRDNDPRVVRSQLALVAEAAWSTRISTPFWSCVVAALCANVFGHVGLFPAVLLPVAVTVSIVAGAFVAVAYRRSSEDDDTRLWVRLFLLTQALTSAAWGLMAWLCWQPGNVLNHVFLALCCVTVLGGLLVARGSNMAMYIASMVPLVAMATLRFLTGELKTDIVIGILAPLVSGQLWYTGRPLVRRMAEDSRLRFHVEDLARELEDARDEALTKRFEAETANASKTAFLANMSHELRTPLNAILGFSEIIAQECFGPVGSDRYRDYAGDIHSSGAHLLSLINDLLDVAKIEAGRMDLACHSLDAAHTFQIALKLIGSKAREKQQTLSIAVEEGAPALWADERAVKQILINLVSNAVKFTPTGGRIDVIGSRAANGDFQILVRDNGPGIPPDKLDKIFSPFSQVDNRFDRQAGGTGLGLALVRGLAELHGGQAWMESDYGHGCSVYVTLPVPAALPAAAVA